MVINGLSNADIQAQITARLRVITAQERKLERLIRTEILRLWRAGGSLDVAVTTALANIEQLLLESHEDTADAVASHDDDVLSENGSASVKLAVLTGMFLWIRERARDSAQVIVQTERERIIEMARRLAADGLTNAEIAAQIISEGTELSVYRARFIAMTEASAVADEVTRREVAETGLTFERKSWVTAGDGRVRDSHIAADDQTVPFTQPFTVGGYEMMEPRDGSLGAPFSEIAGCRCVVNYLTE